MRSRTDGLAIVVLLGGCSLGDLPGSQDPVKDDAPVSGFSSSAALPLPDCAPADCLSKGGFTPPFVEPVVFRRDDQGSDVTLVNPLRTVPSDDRCEYGDNNRATNCKPAGSSLANLADGRVLYFNALEGTENVEFAIFFEVGQVLINEQTRVLRMAGDTATWTMPEPNDGGADADPTCLLPGCVGNSDADDARPSNGSLFCADLSFLPDGKVLASGGTNYYFEPGLGMGFGAPELEGIKSSRIFDPAGSTWTQSGDMHYGRWYPTLTTLANGDVLVASGVTKLQKPVYPDMPMQSGRNVARTETYELGCGQWLDNGGAGERSLPLFPRMHLLPNGWAYYNGGGQAFNPYGEAYDQALWNITGAYDPDNPGWRDIAYAGLPLRFNRMGMEQLTSALNPANPAAATLLAATLQGFVGALIADPTGLAGPIAALLQQNPSDVVGKINTVVGAGFRGSTSSIMLPLRPDADGAYRVAEFLTAGGVYGGGVANSPGAYQAVALSRIDRIMLTDDGVDSESRLTGPLNTVRWYGQGVLLPTGEVMMFSGANRDEVAMPGTGGAVMVAERFDPTTESWQPMATQHNPRTYHNTAMLLDDGRVLVGGHAPINTAYGYQVTLPTMSPNDGRDPSFEIYAPPYAFKARPSIAGAPSTLAHGAGFRIATPDAAAIESVVLVRRTSLTHLVDADQRNVELPIVGRDAAGLELRMPASAAVVPPGPYMLFVVRGGPDGSVPSVSKAVTVSGADLDCDP